MACSRDESGIKEGERERERGKGEFFMFYIYRNGVLRGNLFEEVTLAIFWKWHKCARKNGFRKKFWRTCDFLVLFIVSYLRISFKEFRGIGQLTIFPLNYFANILYDRSKLLRMVKKKKTRKTNLISRCNV